MCSCRIRGLPGHQEARGALAPQGGGEAPGLQGGRAAGQPGAARKPPLPAQPFPTCCRRINRPPGTRVRGAFFATHIFGIKYSFLTLPSKVTGKLSNSLITTVGRLEECEKKKFLGFEIKICGCAYEILTFKTAYHPLQSFSQREMKACTRNTAW